MKISYCAGASWLCFKCANDLISCFTVTWKRSVEMLEVIKTCTHTMQYFDIWLLTTTHASNLMPEYFVKYKNRPFLNFDEDFSSGNICLLFLSLELLWPHVLFCFLLRTTFTIQCLSNVTSSITVVLWEDFDIRLASHRLTQSHSLRGPASTCPLWEELQGRLSTAEPSSQCEQQGKRRSAEERRGSSSSSKGSRF